MTRMKKIKAKLQRHHRMHEERLRQRDEWIKTRRAEWEANGRQGWGSHCRPGPWRHTRADQTPNRP
ncbi:MAG TPA: hypothetical protein VN963_07995, partial [bacterium]|nr:hypothetical protein [bacterium]